jgi:hypothetical protein
VGLLSPGTLPCQLDVCRFCPAHRAAERHECAYDYRKRAAEILAKQNEAARSDRGFGDRLD